MSQLIKDLQHLQAAFANLSTSWDKEYNSNDLAIEEYPFDQSFSVMAEKVQHWVNAAISEIDHNIK